MQGFLCASNQKKVHENCVAQNPSSLSRVALVVLSNEFSCCDKDVVICCMESHNQHISQFWRVLLGTCVSDYTRHQRINAAHVGLWQGWKFSLCLSEQPRPVTEAFPCDEHEYQLRGKPMIHDNFEESKEDPLSECGSHRHWF